jgi:phospholipase A-2-activating protein
MVINVFPLDSPRDEPKFSLIGHDHNVCALHTAPDGTIISGSWDRYRRHAFNDSYPFSH